MKALSVADKSFRKTLFVRMYKVITNIFNMTSGQLLFLR